MTTTKKSPFFSVLICSYNRPAYLGQAVRSILKNDFEDYEVVISDDCSEKLEEIESVVRPFLKRDPRVAFIKQPKNLGWSGNRNFLLSQARGKYVIIIGDDDELYPESLSKLRRGICDFPDYDIYSFGYTVIDEDDRVVFERRSPQAMHLDLKNEPLLRHLFFSEIFPFWFYHPLTLCCSRESISRVRFNDVAYIGDDFLFIFDAINLHLKMLILPEVLFRWRKVQKNETPGFKNISFEEINNLRARCNIYRHLKRREDLAPEVEKVVDSKKFRNVFLFDPILNSTYSEGESLAELGLTETELAELGDYCKNHSVFRYWKGLVRRIFNFVSVTGVGGGVEMLRTVRGRILYTLIRSLAR